MNQKKLFILVVIVLIVAGIIQASIKTIENTPSPTFVSANKVYISEDFGISFTYPKKYFLEEKDLGNGERRHKILVLTEDTEENRLVREGKSPGRDGPISITVGIYQNDIDNLSPLEWVETVSFSNFKLSTGTPSQTSLGDQPAISYSFSGLYEADSIVTLHKGNILYLTVNYLTPNDQIRTDFKNILSSFEFQ